MYWLGKKWIKLPTAPMEQNKPKKSSLVALISASTQPNVWQQPINEETKHNQK